MSCSNQCPVPTVLPGDFSPSHAERCRAACLRLDVITVAHVPEESSREGIIQNTPSWCPIKSIVLVRESPGLCLGPNTTHKHSEVPAQVVILKENKGSGRINKRCVLERGRWTHGQGGVYQSVAYSGECQVGKILLRAVRAVGLKTLPQVNKEFREVNVTCVHAQPQTLYMSMGHSQHQ